jgi:hypothetical protein
MHAKQIIKPLKETLTGSTSSVSNFTAYSNKIITPFKRRNKTFFQQHNKQYYIKHATKTHWTYKEAK